MKYIFRLNNNGTTTDQYLETEKEWGAIVGYYLANYRYHATTFENGYQVWHFI